jgi:LacI family transcriptional regulator
MPRKQSVSRLTDVARLAGVSTATVSRVLNAQGPTSAAARERVLQAAHDLDYHPNWLARSLRSHRTNTIGLVVPDIENPFFTSLVKGVEREAWDRGWNVILANTDESLEREEAVVRTLVERQIDGLLLCAAAGPHEYLARYLAQLLPIVAVNRLVPGCAIPAVTSANREGAYEAMRHLLAAGAPVAAIVGTPSLSTTEGRLRGCREAVAAAGLPAEALLVAVGNGRTESGYKAALACLEAARPPRALLAFNNLMAEAALMAIRDRGLRCPEDVALIGFDDFRSATALSPALSVVEQDPVGMGARAVSELASLVAHGEASAMHVEIPTRLLLRSSCGCGPGRGKRASQG